MNKVNKTRKTVSRQSERIFIAGFYFLTLATHILIISTVIPFQWVNGGMSPSYDAQAIQSAGSIVVTSILFFFVWKMANKNSSLKVWQKLFLYGLTTLWTFGFIMQLLGTSFERYILSMVLLVGIVGHVQMIRRLSKSQ